MTDLGALPALVVGPIELRVPADPTLSRVVRLAASGLASLTGFSVDEIENIKIAVSEMLIALIEHGTGCPVRLEFTVDDDEFAATGTTEVVDFDPDHPDLQLCRTVLAGVCGDHGIDVLETRARIWARVTRDRPRT